MRILLDDLFEIVPTLTDVEFKDIPHTFESAKNAHNVHPMIGSVANIGIEQITESEVKQIPSLVSLIENIPSDKQTIFKDPLEFMTPSLINSIQSTTAIDSNNI